MSAPGQEWWPIIWQWVWNLRVACSAGCAQASRREMEWAPPLQTGSTQSLAEPAPGEEPAYGPLQWAQGRGGRLGAEAFALQDDGTLRCPQGGEVWQSETRRENAFTQRLIVVARDADCAPCPLRVTCLGRTARGTRGRRVSAVRHRRITEIVLHPRPVAAEAAIRWNDVAGREVRRAWMAHRRQETVTLAALPANLSPPARPPRAARSHRRLSWQERLGRNARSPDKYPGHGSGAAGPGSPSAPRIRFAGSSRLVLTRSPGSLDQGAVGLRRMSTTGALSASFAGASPLLHRTLGLSPRREQSVFRNTSCSLTLVAHPVGPSSHLVLNGCQGLDRVKLAMVSGSQVDSCSPPSQVHHT